MPITPFEPLLRLVGPERAVEIAGIRLVGANAVNGMKLLLSLALVIGILALRRAILWALGRLLRHTHARLRFWSVQAASIGFAVLLAVGLVSVWFDDPGRLATGLGLLTAGLAFALQRVVTAVAGYVVILRGRTFNVGDRISMGGVRGDVIALGFTQTTIMEMGQPPSIEPRAEPPMWVLGRQYTGRIVTVSNSRIFDEPVYNYTREFPFLWEELRIPIRYGAGRDRAEAILLEAAGRYAVKPGDMEPDALAELGRRYFIPTPDLTPRVYYRLTDDWLELALRFVVDAHGAREVKDRMARHVLEGFEKAGLSVASATFELVSAPSLRVRIEDGAPARAAGPAGGG